MSTIGSDSPSPLTPSGQPISNINTTPAQLQQLLQYYQAGSGVSALQSLVPFIEKLESSQGTSGQASPLHSQITRIEQNVINGILSMAQSIQNHYTTADSAQIPASLLTNLQAMAHGLQQTPPQQPSDEQLNSLASDLQSLNGVVTGQNAVTHQYNFPPQAQSLYWGQQADLMQSISSGLTTLTANGTLQEIWQQLQASGSVNCNAVAGSMVSLLGVLSQLGACNATDQSQLLQQLQPMLEGVQFNALNPLYSPDAQDYSVSQIAAYSQISEWASSYLQSNPNTTAAQLQSYLQQQSQDYLSGLSSNSVVSNLQGQITEYLDSNHYQTTLQKLGIQTSSSGIVSLVSGSQQDSIAALLQNLGVIQISQAPTPAPSQQVIEVQNAISYINNQLAPYYNSSGISYNNIPMENVPNSVISNIIGNGLPLLVNALNGQDPKAANLASQYLQNTQITFVNQPFASEYNYGMPTLGLSNLAAYLDLSMSAREYAASTSSPTIGGLQTALLNHLSTLPTTGPRGALTALEQQLVNSPTPTMPMGPGQEILPGTQYTPPPPPYAIPNMLYTAPFALYSFSSSPYIGNLTASSPITILENASQLANFPGNQLSMMTSATKGALVPLSDLSPVTPPAATMSPQALQSLQDNQEAMQSLIQQAVSGQEGALVQKALIDNQGGESLQEMFSQAILQHYMPGQESLLQNQATQLNWTNWLGSQYTSLVNDTAGFASANTVLVFSQRLAQPASGNTYNGSAAAASQALQTEQSYVASSITQAGSAIAQIRKILSDITGEGTPETAPFIHNPQFASQIQSLQTTLQSQLNDLVGVQRNLGTLQNVLQGVSVSGIGNTFAVSGPPSFSLSALTSAENILINGAGPTEGDTISMSQTSQNISTQSQQTTSQSQTQQMSLQLSMTEIQQEWSVVSAALQLLNQMASTFYGNITQ